MTWQLESEAGIPVGQQSGYAWRNTETGLLEVTDDEGNANVTQNSQNFAFGHYIEAQLAGYNQANGWAGPAYFDIQLLALDSATNVLLAQNHISVDVIL
jgi:hypothetical protein